MQLIKHTKIVRDRGTSNSNKPIQRRTKNRKYIEELYCYGGFQRIIFGFV